MATELHKPVNQDIGEKLREKKVYCRLLNLHEANFNCIKCVGMLTTVSVGIEHISAWWLGEALWNNANLGSDTR